MKWAPCILALVLMAVPSSVCAQDITGHLIGTVFDEDGAPLAGATVVVSGESVMGTVGTATRDDGSFRVLAIPAGDVQVRISFVGFEAVEVSGVRIGLGETRSLGHIRMRPESFSMDGVTVTGDRPLIDLTTTSVGSGMIADRFSELPIDRGISSVAALLPQANESFLGDQVNIGGATGNENAWYFDGVNTTSGYDGTSIAELPYNFVREIQIKSGGYEAEYGRASGGIISVLTESGSNTVRASAFGFLTNNSLSAEARRSFSDQISTDDFLRYDAGFGIGGPILKDRLWYYAAYNRKVESRDVLFDAIGQRAEESVSNIYAAKLSWRAGRGTRLDLSAFGNPRESDRIGGWMFWSIPTAVENEDPMLGKSTGGTHTVALNVSHVPHEDLLLEGRASWFNLRDDVDPATDRGAREPILVVDSTGIWSGGFPGFGHQSARRASVAAAGTWFVGRHSVKVGIEYEDNLSEGRRIIRSETGPDVGTMTNGGSDPYGGLQGAGAIVRTGPNSWTVHHQNDGADVYGRNATAYLQTRLQVTSRVAVTAGMRWDAQAFRSQDYDYRFTLPWQWQPRIGLVYEPGERGTQKAFVHVGRFYEQVPLASSLTYMVPPLCWFTMFDHDPTTDPTGGTSICALQSPTNYIDGDLSGQYYDAATAGYQRLIGQSHRVGLTGALRSMGQVLNVKFDSDLGDYAMGNPGSGRLAAVPDAVRDYAALELTVDRVSGGPIRYGMSYVLSRNWGNYTGVYGSYTGQSHPNATIDYSSVEQIETGGKGLLPNDRTHAFKFHGAYETGFGLTASTFFTWQTGTPMSELGPHPTIPWDYVFVGTRGSLGRTPSIWDLNFRLTYDLNQLTKQRFRQKVIVDILHALGSREAVAYETRYYGETRDSNPNFLQPVRYQLPMTIRLGVELEF